MNPLNELTARELDAVFATEVAGWKCYTEKRGEYALCVTRKGGSPEPWMDCRYDEQEKAKARYAEVTATEALKIGFFGDGFPKFSTSLDALLPFINEVRASDDLFTITEVSKTEWLASCGMQWARGPSLPRCIAEALVLWKRGCK